MATRPFHPRILPAETVPDAASSPGNSSSANVGREIAALLILAAAMFLLLALGSFLRSPTDPSVEGPNWVGPVGSTLAGWFVQGFGAVAWLIPIELGLVGYPLFRGHPVGPVGLRIAGDLIVGIVAASLVQVMWPDAIAFGAMLAGGNVGSLFGELMRGMFSTLGSLLVGLTIIGLVLLGRSAFSFIELCERTLAFCLRLIEQARHLVQRMYTAWFEARRLSVSIATAPATDGPVVTTRLSEEAIIAELVDDENEWIPFEQTGTPPITILDALRIGPTSVTEALMAGDTPLAPSVVSRNVALKSTVRGVESAEGHSASAGCAGPKIVVRSSESLEERLGERATTAKKASRRKARPVVEAPEDAAGEVEDAEDEDAEDEDAEVEDAEVEDAEVEIGPQIVDRLPDVVVKPRRSPVPRRTRGYRLPATELLSPATGNEPKIDRDRVLGHATRLEKTLLDYGVVGKVEEIHPGPTVTTYEFAPQAGTKVSKVASLADDLALGLSRKVRIIAPIPGKSRIGFEIPNDQRIPVNLRELVEDPRFAALAEKAPLPVVLGRDIVGAPFYADLASMPHVIVAGATGAGKSVGLNVMLASLLFRRSPDELRLLMIDPKVVELAPFDRIPHLLLPVVTDMKQANQALKWAVDEMERRYQQFATAGTKNIGTFNRWVERVTSGELPPPSPSTVEALTQDGAVVTVRADSDGADGSSLPGKLPYIVIVIDEFADLMMQQGKEVETSVARLAQKARAAGLHVVLATQRPSVDVITGMIKANFPSRIAYLVAQKVDSRTILDEQGAEMLLGRGDMLVKMNGANDVRRVQCPFVSEDEISNLTDYIRAQGRPQYHDVILKPSDEDEAEAEAEVIDARFEEAVRIVAETQRCSTSWLQRKMTIGYNRAAKIVETMERRGMVGPPNGAKDREVLILAH